MPVKTPVKKTTKNAQQTKGLIGVKKTVKKITQADIEANFARIQESQDEAWKSHTGNRKNPQRIQSKNGTSP
jgi:hypothetical protein